MDEMFILHPSLIVCGNSDMTQRERPQALINAEAERMAQNTELGAEVMVVTTIHYEHVDRAV